ncbi:gametocyte-specific factor 1-like [Chiloscyllium plagiosum]|uniref:gametocyte-specific factor 1-like n=1 Tax=Chiloscyllium plagiosum TaxID=36176 RepID=UPI001CB81341|nr:gametocyte-specific factor 1-like [Chiloscyllium plagiosum]XP_043542600.1 gametocyte-specific factor 1-like [Chiloscyllium plagiosum]
MNSDQLLVCPYDHTHRIRSSRFPYHLVKCRESHPELANMIRVCPFNARHRIPQPEVQRHLLHCEDGKLAAESSTQSAEFTVPADLLNSTPQAGNRERHCCLESWDDDEEEASSPFVFGQSKFLNGKKM